MKKRRVDVVFSFATVYDITDFEVEQGQVFTLALNQFPPVVQWFAEDDPVLDIVETNTSAQVTAKATGTATIVIRGAGYTKRLNITVRAANDQATTLGITAGKPVLK